MISEEQDIEGRTFTSGDVTTKHQSAKFIPVGEPCSAPPAHGSGVAVTWSKKILVLENQTSISQQGTHLQDERIALGLCFCAEPCSG